MAAVAARSGYIEQRQCNRSAWGVQTFRNNTTSTCDHPSQFKIHELSHIRLNDFRLVGTYVERDVTISILVRSQ